MKILECVLREGTQRIGTDVVQREGRERKRERKKKRVCEDCKPGFAKMPFLFLREGGGEANAVGATLEEASRSSKLKGGRGKKQLNKNGQHSPFFSSRSNANLVVPAAPTLEKASRPLLSDLSVSK